MFRFVNKSFGRVSTICAASNATAIRHFKYDILIGLNKKRKAEPTKWKATHYFAGGRRGRTLRIGIDITKTSLIYFWFHHVLNLFDDSRIVVYYDWDDRHPSRLCFGYPYNHRRLSRRKIPVKKTRRWERRNCKGFLEVTYCSYVVACLNWKFFARRVVRCEFYNILTPAQIQVRGRNKKFILNITTPRASGGRSRTRCKSHIRFWNGAYSY